MTRKITAAVAAISRGGEQSSVRLGNIAVRRDWGGWAPDYVDAMFRMATHETGDDFVVATGVDHSIADFAAAAFASVGITDWQTKVDVDADLIRPADVDVMVGDATKAATVLGWRTTKSFDQIVAAMVESDLGREQPS